MHGSGIVRHHYLAYESCTYFRRYSAEISRNLPESQEEDCNTGRYTACRDTRRGFRCDRCAATSFSGQEIETKTGKTVYGSPKLDTGKQTATDIGKETVITAGISSGVIIPQSSAEIPETPRNSAEKRHKEKESKENSPSIPRTIPPARDDEDKVSLSPDGNRGNVSAESCGKRPEHGEEYRLKLQRLGETCYNLGCSKGDVRKVLMIENIAMDDSPIWQLMKS